MADELTPEQQAELQRSLVTAKDELERVVQAHKAGAEIVDLDTPIGRLSRMDAMQEQQMSAANLRAAELRLKQIGQAQKTIDDGDYGYCRKCDEPIGYRRLKARPEAPLCLSCQGSLEAR